MPSLSKRYMRHARGLMAIGLPLVGSNLAQFSMTMTDSLMLGWYDLSALAAVGIAGSYQFMLLMLGMGIGMAVSPLVAEAISREDAKTGRRALRMAIWLCIGYAALMLPLVWFSEPIMLALGQEPHIAELAQSYLRVLCLAILPFLVGHVMRNFLSAVERASLILWVTLGTAILNVPLNWVLIFGRYGAPEMGVRGAAVATVIASLISLVTFIIYVRRKLPDYDPLPRFWVRDDEALWTVFRLALPIGLTTVAEGGLFAASNVMVGWLGEVPLAAHSIALQLSALTFMGHLGLSQALTVRAGYAYGKRDEGLLRELTLTGKAIALIWVLVTVVLFLGLPSLLVGAFIKPTDPLRPEVMALGIVLLRYAALFQLADAGQVLMASALRGVQDTQIPMYLALVGYWLVGMPAAYLCAFPLGMGAAGVWVGLCVGLAMACLTLGWRFWGRSVKIGQP